MQKIIYQNADDQKEFDIKRFKTSVNKYAKISDKEIEEALKELECFPCLHVARLAETASKLIKESGNTEKNEISFFLRLEYSIGIVEAILIK